MTSPHGRLSRTADEMKTYADHVEGDDGSIRYYLPDTKGNRGGGWEGMRLTDGQCYYYLADTKENRGWGRIGMRLTDCCAAFSTYMDDGYGGTELSCKRCYEAVPSGQGDGSEAKS